MNPRIDARRSAWGALAGILALRVVLGWSHYQALLGFPFVLSPAAELPRLLLSWKWAWSAAWQQDPMWLPAGFWVYGALLRLWNDALLAPPFLNTVFSLGTMACHFALTARLTGSRAAALGAAAFSGLGAGQIILGTSGVVDPLAHLLTTLFLWGWLDGRPRAGLAAGLALALACLTRYEPWLLAAACALAAPRRRAPYLAAIAGAGWLVFQYWKWGSPWVFLSTAHIASVMLPHYGPETYFHRATHALGELQHAGALGTPGLALAWLLVARRRWDQAEWRIYLTAYGLFAAAWILLAVFIEISTDLHPVAFWVLGAPMLAAALSDLVEELPASRRAAAGAALILLIGLGEYRAWRSHTAHRGGTRAGLHVAGRALRACARDGSFPEGDRIIVATLAGANMLEQTVRGAIPLYVGPERVLLDRECDFAQPAPCRDGQGRWPPSALARPDLASWLLERRTAAVLAHTSIDEAKRLPSLGYMRAASGNFSIFVAQEQRALGTCLAKFLTITP
jgi:hypothetical protein